MILLMYFNFHKVFHLLEHGCRLITEQGAGALLLFFYLVNHIRIYEKADEALYVSKEHDATKPLLFMIGSEWTSLFS